MPIVLVPYYNYAGKNNYKQAFRLKLIMKRSQETKVKKYLIRQDSEIYSSPVFSDSVENAILSFIKRKYPMVLETLGSFKFEVVKTYNNDFYFTSTVCGSASRKDNGKKWSCYCELIYDRFSDTRYLKDVTIGAYLKYPNESE